MFDFKYLIFEWNVLFCQNLNKNATISYLNLLKICIKFLAKSCIIWRSLNLSDVWYWWRKSIGKYSKIMTIFTLIKLLKVRWMITVRNLIHDWMNLTTRLLMVRTCGEWCLATFGGSDHTQAGRWQLSPMLHFTNWKKKLVPDYYIEMINRIWIHYQSYQPAVCEGPTQQILILSGLSWELYSVFCILLNISLPIKFLLLCWREARKCQKTVCIESYRGKLDNCRHFQPWEQGSDSMVMEVWSSSESVIELLNNAISYLSTC